MRSLLGLLGVVLLSVGGGACGGASTVGHAPSTPSATVSTATTVSSAGTAPSSGTTSTKSGGIGDKDNDRVGDADNDNNADNDNDASLDYKASEENLYPDRDDASIVYFGHESNGATRRAVTATVKRFYAALGAGNGAVACSLIAAGLAKAAATDYGQGAGPAALRGLKSCAAIVMKLFQQGGAASGEVVVSGVRVQGMQGLALLRFGGTLKPRQIGLRREGREWRIAELIDTAFP